MLLAKTTKMFVSLTGLSFFVILAVFNGAGAQQNDGIKAECIDSLPPFVQINQKWFFHDDPKKSGLKSYVLGGSQRIVQRVTSWHVTGKAEEDACLLKEPCLRIITTDDPYIWNSVSCNNVTLQRTYTLVPDFGYNMTYLGRDGNVARRAVMRLGFTDDKTYIVMYHCNDDGTKSWNFYSILRSMPAEDLKYINDRLDADGFPRMERSRPFIDELCPPDL